MNKLRTLYPRASERPARWRETPRESSGSYAAPVHRAAVVLAAAILLVITASYSMANESEEFRIIVNT